MAASDVKRRPLRHGRLPAPGGAARRTRSSTRRSTRGSTGEAPRPFTGRALDERRSRSGGGRADAVSARRERRRAARPSTSGWPRSRSSSGDSTGGERALCALGALAFNLLVLPRLAAGLLSRGRPGARLPGRDPPLPARRPRARPPLPAVASSSRRRGGASSPSATASPPSSGSRPRRAPPALEQAEVAGAGSPATSSSEASAPGPLLVRRGAVPSPAEGAAFLLAGLAGAVVERLPSELDDNLVPPLAAAGALAALLAALPNAASLLAPGGAPRSSSSASP